LRIDWFKGQSRWYANGVSIANLTKNVPSVASGVVLNVWSDGGEWSGNMTVGGEFVVGVEWIEVAYNVSADGGRGGSCAVGCWIDGNDVKQTGTPAQAYDSTSQQQSVASRQTGTGIWLVGLVAAGAVFGLM
jgi:hypothetical protein